MKISVYGSTGFIGSSFLQNYMMKDQLIPIPRNQKTPAQNSDILYLISTTDNYNVLTNASLDVQTNLVALTERLDYWRKYTPKGTFNFVSSWFVYGNNGVLLSDESSPCMPSGFYSITKYAAEQLVASYAKTFGLNYRILRLCNVVGPGDKNVSPKKNALQYLINQMKAGQPIEIYGDGNFSRNYLHVYDVCQALNIVLEKGEKNTIYNIGNYVNYYFSYMIDLAINVTGYDKSKISYGKKSDFHEIVQVKSFYMNTNKIQNLGFFPVYDSVKMIISCYYS